jgi:hypothetical protein
MKCVARVDELTRILRVTDDEAKRLVASGNYCYVSKMSWRRAKR